ncbi:hypothetical protein GW17_00061541 [Ensete ventricosum]|nr:hypothetical protein GW17_00061541 [Ensete ventricosum]
MVYTISASAWTWLVRSRKASVVTTNGAGLDAGEGNPRSVIILQKWFGVSAAVVTSSVGREWLGFGQCSIPEFPNRRSCDMGPPSNVKMIGKKLLCLPSRCGLPPCLLSKHCWFRPVCASSSAVVSTQSWSSGRGKGFSSGRPLVPTRRSGPYCACYLPCRRSFRGPRDEVRSVPPATGEGRSLPPYLCQVSRHTTDPLMLVLGRAQSRWVGHVVGLAIWGRRDVAASCPRARGHVRPGPITLGRPHHWSSYPVVRGRGS